MKKEAEEGEVKNLKSVQDRVSEATGVSVRSLQRILREQKINENNGTSFSTPNKKRPRKKVKTDIDEFDKSVIRRTINEFHWSMGNDLR